MGTRRLVDPLRPRKLLMHRHEIKRLTGKINERGYALIPLRLYFRDGKAKMELGLAKGKRKYDKRESIRKKDERSHTITHPDRLFCLNKCAVILLARDTSYVRTHSNSHGR